MTNYAPVMTIGIIMILAVVISGCNPKSTEVITEVGGGIIKEGFDEGQKILSGAKNTVSDLALTTWAERKVTIKAGDIHLIPYDYNVSTKLKHVICEVNSDTSISIYIISASEIFNATQELPFISYNACSGEDVTNFKCGESCDVPTDAAFLIKNKNQNSAANVDIKLKYELKG